MSLIFKSLKKLKAQSAEIKKDKKPEAGNVYTFRKLLFSPQAAVFIFLLIMIAGFLTVQGYHFIRDTFFTPTHRLVEKRPDTNNRPDSPENRNEEQLAPNGNVEDTPPAPDAIPVANAAPAKFTLPSTGIAASTETEEKLEDASSLTSGDTPEQAFTATFISPRQDSEADPLKQPPAHNIEPESISTAESISQEQKRLKEKINRQAAITRLVSKIEKSLGNGSMEQTEALLNELSDAKGDKNGYVLKFKAYLFILKKDYREAEQILDKILKENTNDVNAAMNMAVIEARTGRQASAQERLKKLSQRYPENMAVIELVEKLH